MSTATVTITPEAAKARAAELADKIREGEAFLAEYGEKHDAAIRSEVRSGKPAGANALRKRKLQYEDELPGLRAKLRAFQEIDDFPEPLEGLRPCDEPAVRADNQRRDAHTAGAGRHNAVVAGNAFPRHP